MPTYQLKTGVLAKPVSVTVDGTAPSVAQLIANAPPGSTPVIVGTANISLQDQTGVPANSLDITSVKFTVGTTAEIAILPDGSGLANQITSGVDIADQITPSLQFPAAPGTHYAFLRWTYDVDASGSGSVALGPGATVTFSADAGRSGLFALVRQVPDQVAGVNQGCDDMVKDLIGSWRLPKQVTDLNSIPPGTWIVAEADGSISFNLGLQYGYNLNWVRKASLGTLTGDIGLKVQAGIAATLGGGVSGKHAVILSRGSGDAVNKIALRVYRLNVRNWNAGLSASLSATGTNTLLPTNLNDLISGALGTSGTQIAKALQDVETWTNPSQTLLGPLAGVTGDYLSKFFKDVTGKDLSGTIDDVKTQIQKALTTWNSLPQEATKLLWSKLPDATEISSVASLAGEIGNANADSLKTLLASKLANVPFLSTTAGQWLESLATNGLFSALQNDADLTKIQSLAKEFQGLLDGSTVQTFLANLQQRINTSLDLTAFTKIVDQASLDNLDQWLVQKLSAFLGAQPGVKAALADLTNLRDQVSRILAMGQTFYTKALDALTNKYTASFNATYQSTTTGTALIDVVFNFDTNAADAGACLADILNGNLDVIFSGNDHPGITLNQGVLTHEIKRQSSVELTLPYFDRTTTHVNDALASITAVNHGEGRLLAVKDSDDSTQITNKKTKRDSMLSLAMNLTVGTTGVVIHDPTASGSYTLTDTFTSKSKQRFIDDYQTDVTTYFPTEFAPPAPDFTQYATDLAGATGDLGAGTISLQVTVPPKVVLAWLKAKDHANATDVIYKTVARKVLGNYRTLLLQQYFTDTSKYNDVGVISPAFVLLAYASTDLTLTDAVADGHGGFTFSSNDSSKQLLWSEAFDDQMTNAILQSDETKALIKNKLVSIHALLAAENHPKADSYISDDINAGNIMRAALNHPFTQSLFNVEAQIADAIRAACLEMAAFLNSQGTQKDVFDSFEDFASDLTTAFSEALKSPWVSDSLVLPLGPYLLEAAAGVLDPNVDGLPFGAMLTVQTAGLAAPQRLVRLLKPAAAAAS